VVFISCMKTLSISLLVVLLVLSYGCDFASSEDDEVEVTCTDYTECGDDYDCVPSGCVLPDF